MSRHFRVSAVFVFLFLVLASFGVFVLIKTNPESNARIEEPLRKVPVEVRELLPRPFTKVVEAYATVSAYRKGSVSAQVSGPIAKVPPGTDPGDRVQGGQELTRIQDIRYRIALKKAEAALEKFKTLLEIERNENEKRESLYRIAQQRLELAQSEYDRKDKLFQKNLIAQQALEIAESQMELRRSEFERTRSDLQSRKARIQSIQADIASAKAEIRSIQEDISDTVIRAPFGGIIGQRFVELGDHVRPGQQLFTVLDISAVKVMAQVPSAHVDKIVSGTSVKITTRTYPGHEFTGKVVNLYPEADLRNRTFLVVARVVNQGQHQLLPGMFAKVHIPILSMESAFLVSRDLLMEDEKGPYLYLVDRSTRTAHRRDVVVGELADEEAVILSGVKAGEILVVRGQELLHDGAPIQWDASTLPTLKPQSSPPVSK
jgi:RND family efflux transporter MFP subunit